MITFDEACDLAGYTRNLKAPEPVITYFAYKNGDAKQFSTRQDAEQFSKNTERVTTNTDEIAAFWTSQAALEAKAANIWAMELREEYGYLPDAVYNLCYSKAYEDGHSCGYDEIANYMSDYADFATAISEAIRRAKED